MLPNAIFSTVAFSLATHVKAEVVIIPKMESYATIEQEKKGKEKKTWCNFYIVLHILRTRSWSVLCELSCVMTHEMAIATHLFCLQHTEHVRGETGKMPVVMILS